MACDWLSALSLLGIVSPGDETEVDLQTVPCAHLSILQLRSHRLALTMHKSKIVNFESLTQCLHQSACRLAHSPHSRTAPETTEQSGAEWLQLLPAWQKQGC